MDEIICSWIKAEREAARAARIAEEARAVALEHVLQNTASSGRVGVWDGATVMLRWRPVKARSERAQEIKEELEHLALLGRAAHADEVALLEEKLEEAEAQAAALREQIRQLAEGPEGELLRLALAEEEAKVAGEVRPELVLKLSGFGPGQ